MKKLSETVEMMLSENYKERFVAEYWQTKIRYEKLKDFCNLIEVATDMQNHPCLPEAGVVGAMPVHLVAIPKHDCPLDMLRMQQHIMGNYLSLLEKRAIIEGIDLKEE